MEKEEFLSLVRKYLAGATTPAEEQMLLNYFESFQTDTSWDEAHLGDKSAVKASLFQKLTASIEEHESKAGKSSRILRIPIDVRRHWFRYAAGIILVLGLSLYYLNKPKEMSSGPFKQTAAGPKLSSPKEIPPGSNGAVLTLADGSQIVLDSIGNGIVSTQNGVQVKLLNGQLAYQQQNAGAAGVNTIRTPKGRQFQVLLADGTRIWLNASSSITYPVAFTTKERRVQITGEAYLEVAKDKAKPFFVSLENGSEIQVLGTHFNVNAYTDEETSNTTLLEGSIRFVLNSAGPVTQQTQVVLRPGQQAQIKNGGQRTRTVPISVVDGVDLDKVTAWNRGLFNFNEADLGEVMRQLARWYDIEVVYEKGIPDIHFLGEMSRNINLEGVLKILERSEVHFRMGGERKLIVYP